jgi:hypothetical protein
MIMQSNNTNKMVEDPDGASNNNDDFEIANRIQAITSKASLAVTDDDLGEQVVMGSNPEEDLSPFDPANFIAPLDKVLAETPVKPVRYISLRKPAKEEFVRASSDPAYRMSPVYILTWNKGDKRLNYLISGTVVPQILSLHPELVKQYTIITDVPYSSGVQGNPFLWLVRVIGDDEDNSWLRSMKSAMDEAKKWWIRVITVGNEYQTQEPVGELPEPRWPNEPFPKLLKLCFGNRVITSKDDPVMRAIRGETATFR